MLLVSRLAERVSFTKSAISIVFAVSDFQKIKSYTQSYTHFEIYPPPFDLVIYEKITAAVFDVYEQLVSKGISRIV